MAEERNIKINIDSNAKEVARDTNALGESLENVTKEMPKMKPAVEGVDNAYKNFKTQIREANAELQKQIQLTGESSKETIKAAKALADLNDKKGFAKELSDQFNPDQKFKALAASTQIAGTGLQGVTAGMALFGGESADTQKQLLKVQAAMAFSDAISNLSNLGDQWKILKATIASSTLITKANTAATGAAVIVQNAFTGSVATTSTGFKALKFAIAATGIGLLVVGVATLVSNFDKLSKFANSFGWIRSLGDGLKSIVNSVTDFVGVTSEAERLLDKQKAFAEKAIKQNERYLERNASALSDARKKEIELSNEHFKRLAEGRFSEEESKRIYQEARAKEEIEKIKEQNKKKEEIAQKAKDEADKKREKEREDAKKQDKEDAEDYNNSLKEQSKNEADLKQKIIDAIDVAQEKNNEFRISAQEKEIQDVNDKYFTLIENAKKFGLDTTQLQEAQWNERNDINLKYQEIDYENKKKKADDEIEIDKKVADSKKENQDRLISQGESLIANVKNLAGKNKAIQRAAIIADGGIALGKSVANTAEAVTKDLAKGAPFSAPLVALDIAVGATSAASIIKGTADSLRAVGSGGSISGGNTVSVPTIPQSIPQVAFNNTAENQIGKSIVSSTKEQPPVQVVLLESDVTKAQNNVKVLENKNIL